MKKIVPLLFCFLCLNCASAPLTQYYINSDYKQMRFHKVLILPILNYSDNTFAELQIPDMLKRQFEKRKIQVVMPDELTTAIRANNYLVNSENPALFEELAELVDADVILDGRVGLYGFFKKKFDSLIVPYTYYTQSRTSGYVGDDYVDFNTSIPKEGYITIPEREYRYATVEISISLYDASNQKLMFSILDMASSRNYSLQGLAYKLIRDQFRKIGSHIKGL